MSQATPTSNKEVEACIGFCDLPIQEMMHWMHLLPVGSVLAVDSSEPADARDIPLWLGKVHYEFVGALPERDHTRFVARKTH
jgi:TusA-related sulfurtransferase